MSTDSETSVPEMAVAHREVTMSDILAEKARRDALTPIERFVEDWYRLPREARAEVAATLAAEARAERERQRNAGISVSDRYGASERDPLALRTRGQRAHERADSARVIFRLLRELCIEADDTEAP